MQVQRCYFQCLGQAADCAWLQGRGDAIGPWAQAFQQAHAAGDEFGDWDRHGRFIGRARIHRTEGEATLIDAWIPRGGLRPWVGMLASHLQRLDIAQLRIEQSGRMLPLTRLAGWAAPEPDRATPLHPVLAGMADASTQEAMELGQALALLAADPRYAVLPLVEVMRRLKRARGSGQMQLWTNAIGEPRGLLIWARPSAALLAAVRDGSEQRFHAAEWNQGGEPVVLELCAADAASAREVAVAAAALPAVDEARLHIRLDDARGRSTLSSIHRTELDAFADWLASALRPA